MKCSTWELLHSLKKISSLLDPRSVDITISWLHRATMDVSVSVSRSKAGSAVTSLVVLSDGRIAVGAGFNSPIISPLKSVREAVFECAAKLYSPLAIIATDSLTLGTTRVAVQNKQLILTDACENFIIPKNCAASLDEWCVAHDMLMEAVKCGDTSDSRHYRGTIAYWHSELYQYCASLAVGERCLEFVKLMFKKAEDEGVIAKGQIESLINTIAIRRDLDKDNRFVVHAIYQLFVRQVETDERLRVVFR